MEVKKTTEENYLLKRLLRRSTVNPNKTSRILHKFSQVLKPDLLAANFVWRYQAKISEASHVFVLGAPRSGTTLMFSLIASHPQFASISVESYFFHKRNIFNLNNYSELEKGCNQIQYSMENLILASKDLIDLFDNFADCIKKDANRTRIVEKTPIHIFSLNYMLLHYPNAKFINMIRDGRDSYVSIKRLDSCSNMPVSEFSRLWRRCIVSRRKIGDHPNILDVKYEDLVANPTDVTRKVMIFLGETFVPNQIESRASIDAIKKFKLITGHEKIQESITNHSTSQWKTQLSSEEVKKIEKIAGNELKYLKYI